jgi:predicted Ser/Thr protein kinase
MSFPTPTRLGRYEILRPLGKGAMGVVYLARDPLIGRQVALKTFRVDPGADEAEVTHFRSRFIREAQSAGILSQHPGIVIIHDVVHDGEGGPTFIAMEYVEGTDLKAILRSGQRLKLSFIVDIVRQIADALDYAHANGVVHRDVKPANVIVTREGRTKITDFGIARLNSSNLTQDGQLLGTPNYMAPEQVQGGEVDHRADIFSLGVIVYELLTRQKPFQGENLTVVTHRIVYEEFIPPERFVEGLPPAVEAVLHRALDKDPEQRYRRASDLAADLAAAVAGRGEAVLEETRVAPPLPSSAAPEGETGTAASGSGARPPAPVTPPAAATPPAPAATSSPPAVPALPAVAPALPAAAGPAEEAVPAPPPEAPPEAAAAAPPSAASAPSDAAAVDADATADRTSEMAPARPPVPPPAPALAAPAAAAAQPAPSPSGRLTVPRVRVPPTPRRLLAVAAVAAAVSLAAGGLLFLAWTGAQGRPAATALDAGQRRDVELARLLAQGHRQLGAGQPAAAADSFRSAEALAPERPRIGEFRHLAESQAEARELSSAQAAETGARLAAARRSLDQGRPREALSAAQGVLADEPGNAEAGEIAAAAQQALRRRRPEATTAGGGAAAAEPAGAAHATAAASSGAAGPPPPATLAIVFIADLPEGTLVINANDQRIVSEPFSFYDRVGLFKKKPYRGTITVAARAVPAGAIAFKIWVSVAGSAARLTELSGNFPPGVERKLAIHLAGDGQVTANLD